MKKQIFSFVLCFMFIMLLSGCGSKSISDKSKTLSDYVRNHSNEKLGCMGSFCNAMDFYFDKEESKCDILDKEELMYISDSFFVLKNGDLYRTNFGSKPYSNKQNCKKVETDVSIQRVVYYNGNDYLIGTDGKIYNAYNEANEMILKENSFDLLLSLDDNIVKVLEINYNNGKNEYLVLKTDGQIYSQVFNEDKILESEEVKLSNEKFGNIKDVSYYSIDNSQNKDFNNIFTDKGFYSLKVKNKECEEYEDIKCEYDYKSGEVYEKYKSDISYVIGEYAVLKDKNIISSNYLGWDLD